MAAATMYSAHYSAIRPPTSKAGSASLPLLSGDNTVLKASLSYCTLIPFFTVLVVQRQPLPDAGLPLHRSAARQGVRRRHGLRARPSLAVSALIMPL